MPAKKPSIRVLIRNLRTHKKVLKKIFPRAYPEPDCVKLELKADAMRQRALDKLT